MIRLKKDGKYFDIEPGETITTEWVSTVFNDDAEFNGSYTYAVKAPFSPTNNALLKNAHLIENRSARYGTTVLIEIFGMPWKQAKLTYDITPEGYSMNCLIDNAEFAKLIKEKMLPEIFINYVNGVFSDYIYDQLSNSQEETLEVLLNRANSPGTGSCVFYSQKNDGMFGGYDGDGSPDYVDTYRINVYHNRGDFLTDITKPISNSLFYNPSYYLHWVVRKLCQYLGFEATGDFFTDEATKTLIIDNTGFLDLYDVFSLTGCKLAPARHVPNIKIPDFIKMLRATFKLAIYFDGNERKAYFNYANRIIHGTDGVDISGFTESGINIKSYIPTGYELVQAADEDDDLFKTFEYVKSYYIGDNQELQKLSAFAGTLFMTDTVEPRPVDGGVWRVARKRQVGNGYTAHAKGTESYNETGYSKNDFTFRLLNYMGVRYDSLGRAYYYAASDGKNTDGSEHPTALSLWLGGTNGLINRFLKEWLMYYLRTEEVEITAHLPANLLLQLSPIKKLTWSTHTRALIPAMINQVSFEQSGKYAERIAAKIKVYPIYNQAATDVRAFTEVKLGEVENAGKIYVKYEQVVTQQIDKELFGNGVKVTMEVYVNGFLNFFSDEACKKPRNVSNLPVYMFYQYRGANSRNYVDSGFKVIASGTSYQVTGAPGEGINQVYHYKNGKDYWSKKYFITPGADYTIVT